MSDRDFIEEMQEEAVLRFGKELLPHDAAERFALHGNEARIQLLKRLHTPEAMDVRTAAKRHAMERALRNVHFRLQKAGGR
jgi:hypothetical protein